MDLQLSGRTALVTGSWRGTGAGIARVLAAEGATVLVHGFEPGQAHDVTAGIVAGGGSAREVVGDLRTDEGAERLAGEVGDGVDILVANYGVAERGDWWSSTSDDWVDLYQKNVLSAVRVVQAFVPPMRERGWGRVVVIGTVGTVRPNRERPGYYASKSALPAMTVSLAKELAGTGITVNLVSPGLVATAEVRAWLTRMAAERGWGDDWNEIARRAAAEVMPNPAGRVAEPEDVGALVAYLCSPQAALINGTNLRIDGGGADTVTP
ncbi:MAG: SDR family oxidoreductase [Acidimicrobiia bacterium]|nr:SDR family oxidoreductase [Acidimicrobiia bacterium]